MEVFLRYAGTYTIIYFVFRKASKPLKDKWKWINYGIRPVILLSFIANISVIIWVMYQIKMVKEGNAIAKGNISCQSYVWVVSSLFDQVSVIIFLFFVTKL